MQSALQRLTQYAAYHRDRRNIVTHFIGIPMIVFAVALLLSRPRLMMIGPVALTPALLLTLVTSMYYLRLDWRLALPLLAFFGLCLALAQPIAAMATAAWLGLGVGVFVLGWVFQFVGHYYEGRKPAFVDDLMGLVIGPLFVTAELAFALGLRLELKQAIEAQVGPTGIHSRGLPVRS
jgi:Predicted membrane protein